MAATFHIDVLSASARIFKGVAVSLVVPAEYGSMGILAHHAPLVARLGSGNIVIRDGTGKNTIVKCARGFLEVMKNHVTLLLDG